MPDLPSVLVVRLSSLGDVLFAVPAVQHLQDSGVAGRVAWLVEDRARALIEGLVPVDEVVVFPRGRKRAWPAHAAALRRRRDDVVLDFQCNFKSRLQRAFLRAPRQLGFGRPLAREGGDRGLTARATPPPRAHHRIELNLSVVALMGLPVPSVAPRPRLSLPDDARRRAEERLAPVPGEGPVVVLHPGTSAFGAFKRWDPGRFGALARHLVERHDARILVTGGPGEESLVAEVVAAVPRRGTAVPPEGLVALAALLDRADLAVAADSLPLHLANALGTAVVGLYGPKDPAVNGPYFDRSQVVRAGVACSPCSLRRCADRLCMRRLTLDAVVAAADRALREPGS